MVIVPVVLLLVLVALDLGRVFTGWVVLNNAARVGANYAATNPDAWDTRPNTFKQTTYDSLVRDARDEAGIALGGCDVAAVPDPDFPNGTAIGDYAVVTLDCGFQPLTPLIGDILTTGGNPMTVSARAVFPVRSGGLAVVTPLPPTECLSDFSFSTNGLTADFQDTTVGPATAWFWVFEGPEASAAQDPSYTWDSPGTYPVTLDATVGGVPCTQQIRDVTVEEPPPSPDPSASPTPSPTADPNCSVPSFIGERRRDAQDIWDAAGFSTTVQLVAGSSATANWDIEYQSLNSGNSVACNVTIEIGPDPLASPAP